MKLNNLNIAKDNFKKIDFYNYPVSRLKQYYEVNIARVSRLILEDELVGNSCDNLDYLESVLSSKKVKVKRLN